MALICALFARFSRRKFPFSTLYFSNPSLYAMIILPSATRKPDTSPIVATSSRKITRYFPNSVFSSRGRRFLSGFFIFFPPYHSRSSACSRFSLITLLRIMPSFKRTTRVAMSLIASLWVTMIMVLPYFSLTVSISFRISLDVL